MNYKELDKRTQDLVKFANFLKLFDCGSKNELLSSTFSFPRYTN